MPRLILLVSALLVSALLACGTPLRAEVTLVDSAALEQLRQRGVPVIDIRTPQEWHETGIIEGSHLLTFFDTQGRYDVRAWLSGLAAIASPDEPVALICHSGGRSALVGQFLDAQLGFRRVHDVPGGIEQWLAEDRPTVSPRCSTHSLPVVPTQPSTSLLLPIADSARELPGVPSQPTPCPLR